MENTINTIRHGNYFAIINKREELNRKKFPNHLFQVIAGKDTPKGKYAKMKILNNFVFKTLDEATTWAENYIGNIKRNTEGWEAKKVERRQANKEVKASDFYEIGDIVYNSWGYEQTNIEFYQVIAVLPKKIRIQEIRQTLTEATGAMSGSVIANKNDFLNVEPFDLIVRPKGELASPKSFYYFKKWDGKPKYKSWYY